MLGVAFYYLALVVPLLKLLFSYLASAGVIITGLFLLLGTALLFTYRSVLRNQVAHLCQLIVGVGILACFLAALLLGHEAQLVLQKSENEDVFWHVIDANTTNTNLFDQLT